MKKIITMAMIMAIFSCTTPQMLVDNQLQHQSVHMPVNGRHGWMMNQELEFGSYRTGKVSRGWTKSYQMDLMVIGFQGTREKYSFTIKDEKNELYTLCANQVKGVDIPIDRLVNPYTSRDLFSFTIQTKDLFTASIIDNSALNTWNLLIANRDDFRKNGNYVGLITSYTSEPIMILPVRKLQDQKSVGMDIVGFEFKEGDKIIGAVETINSGKVWIDNSLDENRKLLLAAASTALLLQNDLYFHPES